MKFEEFIKYIRENHFSIVAMHEYKHNNNLWYLYCVIKNDKNMAFTSDDFHEDAFTRLVNKIESFKLLIQEKNE